MNGPLKQPTELTSADLKKVDMVEHLCEQAAVLDGKKSVILSMEEFERITAALASGRKVSRKSVKRLEYSRKTQVK